MAEATEADLKPLPALYQSSRKVGQPLIGEDTCLPLIEASTSGDLTVLKSMLAQPTWIEIALGSSHIIYHDSRPPQRDGQVREVSAMIWPHLQRIILKAAESGHAAAVSTLMAFASQHGVKPSTIVVRETLVAAVENDHAEVFETFVAADPRFLSWSLGHGGNIPLYLAVELGSFRIVGTLLRLGAGRPDELTKSTHYPLPAGYPTSLLCHAAAGEPDGEMLKLLLHHGFPIVGQGALQSAAERGKLQAIELLIEQGADVNDILTKEQAPRFRQEIYTTWTPMHFAASAGKTEAMALLETKGGRADVRDAKGRTPAQVLEERNEGLRQKAAAEAATSALDDTPR